MRQLGPVAMLILKLRSLAPFTHTLFYELSRTNLGKRDNLLR